MNNEQTKPHKKIENIIARLRSNEAAERIRARQELVRIGKPAVPYLIHQLNDTNEQMRWETCKALASIKDPIAAGTLVNALRDYSVAVRWLAAEALIELKRNSLPPLLLSLEKNFESPFLREGAHHVLHALERQNLLDDDTTGVLDSLRSIEPKVSVAVAARKALSTLEKRMTRKKKPVYTD